MANLTNRFKEVRDTIDTEKETHKDGDYGLTLVYTITSS